MPWLSGAFSTTPGLDKTTDAWGSDVGVNTLCRVWGHDPEAKDIEVTQLQCAIVASTVRCTFATAPIARESATSPPAALT